MNIRLFSLMEKRPEGFEPPDADSYANLDAAVIYSDSAEKAIDFIDSNPEITCGVITVTGGSFLSKPLRKGFWLLEIPPENFNDIGGIARHWLDTFGCGDVPSSDDFQSLQHRIYKILVGSSDDPRSEYRDSYDRSELRQIYRLAGIGYWSWDLESGEVVMSDELCRIYAISPGKKYSAIEDMVQGFTHPDDLDTVEEEISKASRGIETSPVTFRIIRPKGEIRWIAAAGPDVVRRDEEGNPLEIKGIQQDVTHRKTVEEKLRESQVKLEDAAGNMPGVVFQFFVRRTGEYGLDFVSGNTQKVLGIEDDSADMFDEFVSRIPYEKYRDEFYSSIHDALTEVRKWNIQIPFQHSEDKKIQLRIISEPRLLENVLIFNGVMLDVTEEQNALLRAEHLNSILRAIRNINQLIVQEKSIERLLKNTCDTLIETRSYNDCSIALLNEEMEITEVFQTGTGSYSKEEFLSPPLPVCIQRMFETDHSVLMNDRGDCGECRFLGSHGRAFHPTFVSPLHAQDRIAGVLFVGLVEGSSLSPEECDLLDEIAGDLGYAMEKLSSEKKLIKSEEKYRKLFDSSQDAIMTLEPPSWKFTSGNPSILEMFQVSSREEFTSMGPWELSPEYQPDGRPSEEKAREMIEKAMEEGSNYFQWTHMRKDGDCFPATVLLTRVDMEDGSFLQATVRDITEQKALEDAIRTSEMHIRGIANSVPGVLYQSYVTPEGDSGFNFVSEKSREILGIDWKNLDEFYTQLVQGIPMDHRGAFLESIEKAERKGTRWEYTTPFIRPDGEEIWIRGMSIPTRTEEGITFNGVFVDETRQVQVEKALREERDYSSRIIRGTPAIVCGISPEGITNFINPAGENVTGYASSEIVGRSWWKVFYPGEEYRQVENLFRKFDEDGNVRDHEMTLTTRNGDKRIISWSSINRTDENGSITEIVGFGFDVTQRRKAQEELKKSEQLFRSVVENAPAGIFMVDDNYVVVYANEQLSRMSGYTVNELVGMDFRDVLDEKSRKKVAERYKRRQKGEDLEKNYEIGVFRKDGTKRLVIVYVDHMIDPTGKSLTLGEIIDITERKKTERELNQLRNYMANIIDSMPSVLIGVSKDGRITLWNSRAAARTGLSNKEVFGEDLSGAVPWLKPYVPFIKESIDSRSVKYEPKQVFSRDGETRYEDITVYPLVADHVDGAVIRLDDVTEQVHLEEMMIQSEKMLSVGGLAAGMAHEINNPLAGMMQNAEVILRRLSSDLPANDKAAEEAGTTMEAVRKFLKERKVIRQLELIHKSGKRAAMIVQNMLSFARKGDSSPAPADLSRLLESTIELAENDYDLKKKYDFRHVELVREYEENVPEVPCNSSKIQQVFLNILRNGTEAMYESRKRTGKPEDPHFILRIKRENGYAVAEIEDNGPGIPKELKNHVFEPFFTTKEVGVGTGLGLSVSYFIIKENHGGELEVESKPGRYTRFIVRLPVEGKTNNGR